MLDLSKIIVVTCAGGRRNASPSLFSHCTKLNWAKDKEDLQKRDGVIFY